MAWTDVSSHIIIQPSIDPLGFINPTGFDSTTADLISLLLQNLYANSATARSLLQRISDQNVTLTIFDSGDLVPGHTAVPGSDNTSIDIGAINKTLYFNSGGALTTANASLVLIHEIYHAVTGAEDLGGGGYRGLPGVGVPIPSDFDPLGPTVRFQNVVATELGLTPKLEASYGAVFAPSVAQLPYLAVNASYTNGLAVDVVDVATPDTSDANSRDPTLIFGKTLDYENVVDVAPDTSGTGVHIATVGGHDVPADELLIAFDGNNQIYSGGGNDFLYGGNSNDTFNAGAGTNFIDGGNYIGAPAPKSQPYTSDGVDTVDYQRTSNGQTPLGAIVLLDAGATDRGFLDKKTISVTDNGYVGVDGNHGNDQLFSIEKIKGVKELDVFSFDLGQYALTPSTPSGSRFLYVTGVSDGGLLKYFDANQNISFVPTTDADGVLWNEVDVAGTTGLLLRQFSVWEIRGDNDTVRFGSADQIPLLKLAGSGDIADLSGSSLGNSASIALESNDSIVAGSGGLQACSLDLGSVEGKLVMPETWGSYNITYDDTSDCFTILASDGSAGAYVAKDLASFQFSDGTLSADQLLNQAPSDLRIAADHAIPVFANPSNSPTSSEQIIGHLTVNDVNSLDNNVISLTGPSAQYFNINEQGNLYLKAGVVLDYATWRSAIANAIGGQPTDSQIAAALSSGTWTPGSISPAALAALTTQFAGTPYEVTTIATDLHGATTEQTFFPLLNPISYDLPIGIRLSSNGIAGFTGNVFGDIISDMVGEIAPIFADPYAPHYGYSFAVTGGHNDVYRVWNGQVLMVNAFQTLEPGQSITVTGTAEYAGTPVPNIPQITATFTVPLYDSYRANIGFLPWIVTDQKVTFSGTPAATVAADANWAAGTETASGTASAAGLGSVQSASVAFVGSDGGNVPMGNLATVVTGGQVNWNYSANDHVLAGLADGQTVHEFWAVTARDINGAAVTHDVEIALTRSADQTQIASADTTGAVVQGATAGGTEAASGTIAFTDADGNDVHAVSARFVSSDGGLPALGAITATLAADTAGSGLGGQVGWNYAVDNAALAAALRPGQTVHQIFAIDIGDGHGGTTTQDVTVEIQGSGPVDIKLEGGTGNPTGAVAEGHANPVFDNMYTMYGQHATWNDQVVGQLAVDEVGSSPVSYSLVCNSAQFFSIDGSGNLILNAGTNLDFQTWHAAIETALGGNATDAQIHADLGSGTWAANAGIPADALAALAAQFNGTPYAATVRATDANGQSTDKTFFLDVRDVWNDLAKMTVQIDNQVSELAPVGTVVATVEGLDQYEPIQPSMDWDPTHHFIQVQTPNGFAIETARPLDYAAQSHYDFTIGYTTFDQNTGWQYAQIPVPIDVTSANLQPADPTQWLWTPSVADIPENSTQAVLIGTVTPPAGFNGTFSLDGNPDSWDQLDQNAFEMRGNELWYTGSMPLDRMKFLPNDPVLHLTLAATSQDGGDTVRWTQPVDIALDHVFQSQQTSGWGQFYSGLTPDLQSQYGSGYVYNVDSNTYDDSYSFALVSGTDDSDLFSLVPSPWGSNADILAPKGVLDGSRSTYTVDVDTIATYVDATGTHTVDEGVSKIDVNISQPDPWMLLTVTLGNDVALISQSGDSHETKIGDIAFNGPDAAFASAPTLSGGDASFFEVKQNTDGNYELWLKAGTSINYYEHPYLQADIATTDAATGNATVQVFNLAVNPHHPPNAAWEYVALPGGFPFGVSTAQVSVGAGSYWNGGVHTYATGEVGFSPDNSSNDPANSTLTVSADLQLAGAVQADGSNLSLTDTQIDAIKAGFTFGPATDWVPTTPVGYEQWQYHADGLTFLSHGQHVTLVADLVANDGLGLGSNSIADQAFTINIWGQDTAPTIVGGPYCASFTAGGEASASGQISFADADVGDVHTITTDLRVSYCEDFFGNILGADPTPMGIDARTHPGVELGTLTMATSSEPGGDGSNGDVSWTYTVDQTKAQMLAQGETASECYDVTVDDGHGGIFYLQPAFYVTGINDAPTIVDSAAASVTGANGQKTAAGIIHFSDPDWIDTHVVSETFVSGSNGENAPLGTMTAAMTADTQHGTGGEIGWNYAVDDNVLAGIPAGQTVHELFDVAVQDNHGAIAHQQVAIDLSHLQLAA